ncbi:PaaI family thioesterase [Schlegelella sp. S2-27]|uniref:Medium/long-chain acyl-CoA thioesterase YigI n=1 Tax=Caldimonas mangrovi TaxID=2944811 RepID=A0ABT0YID8_9BURK|nr:PaaI family thioesterase [Caldimonas mangrovi]
MDTPGTDFTCADPGYVERVRGSFERQTVMGTFGIALVDVAPGRVVLEMPHRADLTQQHGFLHAGVVSTALDSACGYAAFSLMPADAAVLTIEFKVNLVAPARGPVFRFEGTVIKPGRTITVVEGRAIERGDKGERLVATMTATVMTVLGRVGIHH